MLIRCDVLVWLVIFFGLVVKLILSTVLCRLLIASILSGVTVAQWQWKLVTSCVMFSHKMSILLSTVFFYTMKLLLRSLHTPFAMTTCKSYTFQLLFRFLLSERFCSIFGHLQVMVPSTYPFVSQSRRLNVILSSKSQ